MGGFTRLHRVTGDDLFDAMARLAARAVAENSWRGVLGQCHGLAGNGEFCSDLAESAPPGTRCRDRELRALAHRLRPPHHLRWARLPGRACRVPGRGRRVNASRADG
ncbi:hypothetical protein HBB16_05165 [Pseudonocardia sp. MCCB 268]|nr:hypothetical protein [Pseudonocardia cytotoxica]